MCIFTHSKKSIGKNQSKFLETLLVKTKINPKYMSARKKTENPSGRISLLNPIKGTRYKAESKEYQMLESKADEMRTIKNAIKIKNW
jgi:hypothetical protein